MARDYYILDDQYNAVKATEYQYVQWIRANGINPVLKHDNIGGGYRLIYTYFQGNQPARLPFCVIVYGITVDGLRTYYPTYKQAIAGHDRIVAQLHAELLAIKPAAPRKLTRDIIRIKHG